MELVEQGQNGWTSPLQPAEQDVVQLIATFLTRTSQGQPLSLNTFKKIWIEHRFSFIFLATPPKVPHVLFVQILYNVAMSLLIEPIPLATLQELLNAVRTPSMQAGNVLSLELNGCQLTDEDIDTLCAPRNPSLIAAALYCLSCLYWAQHNRPFVRIRLNLEQQIALQDSLPIIIEAEIFDAAGLMRELLRDGALVPGCPDRPLPVDDLASGCHMSSNAEALTAGGMPTEEAAALREAKFHLDSVLRGLGTGHLEQLCRDYRYHLLDVWQACGDGASPPAEGVAELGMGRQIHEYITSKGKDVANILHGRSRGQKWPKAPDAGPPHEAQPSGEGIATIRGLVDDYSMPFTSRTAATARVKHPLKRVSVSAGRAPAVTEQLRAREEARRKDIARRAAPWAERLGIKSNVIMEPLQSPVHDNGSEEDMPSIPGIPSSYSQPMDTEDGGDSDDEGDGAIKKASKGKWVRKDREHGAQRVAETDVEHRGGAEKQVVRRSVKRRQKRELEELLAAIEGADAALAEDFDF